MRGFSKISTSKQNSAGSWSWLWWTGFLLTGVSIGGAWWEIISQETGAIGVGILIAFTGYVISERLIGYQSFKFEHQIKTDIDAARDEVISILKNSFQFQFVGNHRDALQDVALKMPNATHPRDTYFRKNPARVIFGYPDIGPQLYREYMALARRRGEVDLIISKHNLPMIQELAQALAAIAVEEKETPPLFKMYELDHHNPEGKSIPIINITILRYGSDSGEVFFGWDYLKGGEGIVFSSREKKAVDYFDGWYDALVDVAKEYDLRRGFENLGYIDTDTGRRVERPSEEHPHERPRPLLLTSEMIFRDNRRLAWIRPLRRLLARGIARDHVKESRRPFNS